MSSISNLTRARIQHIWCAYCQGATGGDSFSCREYHVGAAKSDAAVHCPHASLYGGGVCKEADNVRVRNFCTTYSTRCAGTGTGKAYSSCVKDLTDKRPGVMGVTTGDSLSCREYHLGAAKSDAARHCPHASLSGGGECEPPLAERVTQFCDSYKTTCNTHGAPYDDCKAEMTAKTKGPFGTAPFDATLHTCLHGHGCTLLSDSALGNTTRRSIWMSYVVVR